MVRIIYLDIDGTLRDEAAGISARVKTALRQCQITGIQIIACTGRSPGCIQEDVLALRLDGIISGGGCYIDYRGKRLFSQHISTLVVKEFLDYAEINRLGISLELEQGLYMNERIADFYRTDAQKKFAGYSNAEIEVLLQKSKLSYRDTLAQYCPSRDSIHKICIIGSQAILKPLQDHFASKIQIIQNQPWHDQWYLECLPVGCTKGTAVEQLNRLLHIPRAYSMSFGDGGNDIDLLRAVGTGVAVAGGDPRLVNVADSVCEPPSQDGIYKELSRRHLIPPDLERSVLYG